MLFKPEAQTIVCPNRNCGLRVVTKATPRGNPLILVGLLLCGILPGVLYALFASGYTYSCPACGMRVGADLMR